MPDTVHLHFEAFRHRHAPVGHMQKTRGSYAEQGLSKRLAAAFRVSGENDHSAYKMQPGCLLRRPSYPVDQGTPPRRHRRRSVQYLLYISLCQGSSLLISGTPISHGCELRVFPRHRMHMHSIKLPVGFRENRWTYMDQGDLGGPIQ